MEAHLLRAALFVAAFFSLGAGYRTPNFIVEARSGEFARRVGDAAETYRRELAKLWTGKQMPNWASPCPIRVRDGARLGAGGVTSFVFDKGHVFGWQMSIQGPQERILDSVLPHEVSHTVFATYFRRPLPRWADEGACTTVEHASERAKQNKMLIHFLKSQRGIPFSRMLVMKEYPRDILPLYSQGYSLSRFLIEQGGRPKFIQFIKEGMQGDQWTAMVSEHYGYEGLAELQNDWLEWVKQGSPRLSPAAGDPTAKVIAMATGVAPSSPGGKPGVIFRAQSEDAGGVASAVAQAAGTAPAVNQRERNANQGEDTLLVAAAHDAAPTSRWQAAQARNFRRQSNGPTQIAGTPRAQETPTADVKAPQYGADASYAPGSVIPPTAEDGLDVTLRSADSGAGKRGGAGSRPRQVYLEWSRPETRADAAAANADLMPPADSGPAARTATADSLVPIRR